MYEKILKPIFFRFDPERAHDFFTAIGEWLGSFWLGRTVVRMACHYENPMLETDVRGVHFKNPIGLGAGYDKDVRLTHIMPAVGFGFMEVGAITHLPYKGNDGLWLARLPADQSLVVHYGLKNRGASAINDKLNHLKFQIPVGVNIAKTNSAEIKGDASVKDYVAAYRILAPRFAYVTLNVSCPNAQDGFMFQEPHALDGLLAAIVQEKKYGPVFLKISSHLSTKEIDDILAVVEKYPFVDGFIVANLMKRRELYAFKSSAEQLNKIPDGGISGRPMKQLSTDIIRHIYRATKEKYVLIGLGGVFTAEDAYEKIKAGASLVQMVTGLIYGGPLAVKRINKGLVKLLERDGFKHVNDAVGTET
jgi:dihydroorotate dehydrogenase subfamily 2